MWAVANIPLQHISALSFGIDIQDMIVERAGHTPVFASPPAYVKELSATVFLDVFPKILCHDLL